jgi:hypothetical protein
MSDDIFKGKIPSWNIQMRTLYIGIQSDSPGKVFHVKSILAEDSAGDI